MGALRSRLFSALCTLAVLADPWTVPAMESGSRLEEVYDLGAVTAESRARHVLDIPNKGNAVMRINRVYASCDGLQVLSYPESVPPGKKGRLELRLIPSKTGPVACDVTIETDAAGSPALIHHIKGIIEGNVARNETHPERSSIPDKLLTRRTKDRNPALMISVDAVMKDAGGNQAMVLVDVRDAKDFEKFHIPGSVNIPPYALKTRQFLRDRPVVLIAEGHSISELERECERLRGAGFRASILEGGLREWMRRPGPPAGNNSAAARDLMQMSPRAFFEERHYSHWVVLDACQWKRGEAGTFIPEAIPLPCPDSPDHPEECIKAARYKKGSDSSPFFLVFTDEGKGYGIMERKLHEAGMRNVFFLRGGLAAYEAFLEQQSRLGRAEDRKKEKDEKCSSCQ